MDKHNDLLADNKFLKQQIEQIKKEKNQELEVLQQEKLELFQVYERRYKHITDQLRDMQNDPFWKIIKPARAVVKSIWKFTQKLRNQNEHKANDAIINEKSTLPLSPDYEKLYATDIHLIKAAQQFDFAGAKPKIAVQIHLYWIDLIDEILAYLDNIPFEFDCFISTDTDSKAGIIADEFKSKCRAINIKVEVFENRGRDVAPFLMQMRKYIDDYEYICHVHSKKTDTGEHGDIWREYLYTQLLGSPDSIKGIIAEFEKSESLGIAFPETFPTLIPHINWSGCKGLCENLLGRMDTKCEIPSLPEKPIFSAGSMFWARTQAVKPLFLVELSSEDFPKEGGQIRKSLAHAIERIWVYLAKAQGYGHMVFLNMLPKILPEMKTSESTENKTMKRRIAFFVHGSPDENDTNKNITDSDLQLLKSIQAISDFVVFITGSKLSKEEKLSLSTIADKVIVKKGVGLDFGAWKDGILEVGFEHIKTYDQLILLSNGIVGPVYDLNNVFEQMDVKKVDFWGLTAFPQCVNNLYIARNSLDVDRIPEYVESYFQVFEKSVISSKIFRDFWENLPYHDNRLSERKNAEFKMTGVLKSHGFKCDVYIKVGRYLREYYDEFDMLYMHPYPLLIAGSPFVIRDISVYAPPEERDSVNHILNFFNIDSI